MNDPTHVAIDGSRTPCGPRSRRVLTSQHRERDITRPMTEAMTRFVYAYMIRRNASRAYADTYPECQRSTAETRGPLLLKDPRVRREVDKLMTKERERLNASVERISDHLAAVAFSSLGDMFDENGVPIPLHKLPREVQLSIKKVRVFQGGCYEVELFDRLAALRMLGLEHEMFRERVEVSADDQLLETLRQARARALAAPPPALEPEKDITP